MSVLLLTLPFLLPRTSNHPGLTKNLQYRQFNIWFSAVFKWTSHFSAVSAISGSGKLHQNSSRHQILLSYQLMKDHLSTVIDLNHARSLKQFTWRRNLLFHLEELAVIHFQHCTTYVALSGEHNYVGYNFYIPQGRREGGPRIGTMPIKDTSNIPLGLICIQFSIMFGPRESIWIWQFVENDLYLSWAYFLAIF